MNRFDGGIFLENIEWFDESGKELVHRLPENGSGEIKFGAQLTVRESQAAVFFYKGKACDCFGPGRYTLRTGNLPLITKILSIPWRGDSPLRAEVYMANLKHFTNNKWGTQNPVAFRDSELGLIRLRAHGIYNIQIVQPVLFINSLVGTMGSLDTDAISSYLKQVIVSRFNDYLGETLDTIFNLPGRFDQLSAELQNRLAGDFADYGLRLTALYITSITPPEEVQSAIDDKSRMELIHDMEKFMKLKAAMAMEKISDSHGEAGAGLGLGMGMLLPSMFTGMGAGATGQQNGSVQSLTAMIPCPDCQNSIPADSRFCPICGHQILMLLKCAHCGKNLTPKAKFCPQCGKPTDEKKEKQTCPNCQTENLSGSMFCNNCGLAL
jgi:membrane protease subunit (stomatin/prohibitin family)